MDFPSPVIPFPDAAMTARLYLLSLLFCRVCGTLDVSTVKEARYDHTMYH